MTNTIDIYFRLLAFVSVSNLVYYHQLAGDNTVADDNITYVTTETNVLSAVNIFVLRQFAEFRKILNTNRPTLSQKDIEDLVKRSVKDMTKHKEDREFR